MRSRYRQDSGRPKKELSTDTPMSRYNCLVIYAICACDLTSTPSVASLASYNRCSAMMYREPGAPKTRLAQPSPPGRMIFPSKVPPGDQICTVSTMHCIKVAHITYMNAVKTARVHIAPRVTFDTIGSASICESENSLVDQCQRLLCILPL